MGHPQIDNQTALAVSFSAASDENGRPLLVVFVQATYAIAPGRAPTLSDEQPETSLVGELWGEDSAVSSYRIEPAYAFMKPATDVVLLGQAHAPARPVTELEVAFRVGALGKTLRVIGDRSWVRANGVVGATRPQPFVQMPLSYERAFGGWDRSHADPASHGFEPRNPIGVGYRTTDLRFEEGIALPNLEDPRDPIRTFGQHVAPAGVGFVSPHWSPRAEFGGTHDAAWVRDRQPLLPGDFDRRFFNAASPGLIAAGYLRGDEQVVVENACAAGRLSFSLPGTAPPRCKVELRGLADADLETALDTVVVDTDKSLLRMTYRAHTTLRAGLHDVRTIRVAPPPST